MAGMPSIAEALTTARGRLAGSPSATSEAEELVTRLLGLTRTGLYLDRAAPIDPLRWARLGEWLDRRALGEPIAYITGRAAFRGLDLAVARSVLIPRPETEGLVQAVLDALDAEARRWPSPRVLDLGTGSGAIALAIAAECPRALVTATDVSDEALEIARANAIAHGLVERVPFMRGDWFEAIGADDRFEVIVSNPPYIATGEWDALPDDVRGFEPHLALFSGTSGLEALREIVDEAPRHLVAGGVLALELAESRAELVAGWIEGAHDWSGVRLIDDLAGRPRVLLARRERGPAIAPAQWEEER